MDEYYSANAFGMMLNSSLNKDAGPRNMLIELSLERSVVLGHDAIRIAGGSILFDPEGEIAAIDIDGFIRQVHMGQLPSDPRLAGFFKKVLNSLISEAAIRNVVEFPIQVPWYPLSIVVSEIIPL